MSEYNIRAASSLDLPRIKYLLESEGLPYLGVPEHVETFYVAESDGTVFGVVGLEVYDDTALLRSAVVLRSEQNKGVGGKLYQTILSHARANGIRRLILLTNTAEEYFSKKGFSQIPQSSVTGPVTSSVEFSGACPSHAVCMELTL